MCLPPCLRSPQSPVIFSADNNKTIFRISLHPVPSYRPARNIPDLRSEAFLFSVAPVQCGNRALTPLRPEPYTALMPATFSSRHYNFDCRTLIISGVKLIPWICSGVLLPQGPGGHSARGIRGRIRRQAGIREQARRSLSDFRGRLNISEAYCGYCLTLVTRVPVKRTNTVFDGGWP
jgi:hypothetical protein